MDTSLWGLGVNNKDHLVLGGCDVVELAKSYGTPLHVVDAGRLRSNYHRFVNAFRSHYDKVKVFYSYKTNPVPGVLRILHDEGCGAEVVSPYELWLAFRLGVQPSEIIYYGINRSEEDLKTATREGVGLIIADSMGEIHRLKKASQELHREVNFGIRVYPQVGWEVLFGLQPIKDNIIGTLKELKNASHLNLRCLHTHIGTGITKTREYEKAVEFICSLMEKIKEKLDIDIECLNIGGGFGVPTVRSFTFREIAMYKIFNISPREPNAGSCPPPGVFGRTICDLLTKYCARYGLKEPHLLLEPGRVITSDAQMLLLTVGEIKKMNNGTKAAVTDGGMLNIASPLSYEYHKCFLANRASAEFKDKYFVAGSLCAPGDILYRNWKLPELRQGDVLAVMDAGAYFTTFSNNFSYPKPAVVLVSDGRDRIVRRRESFEHMTAMDAIEEE